MQAIALGVAALLEQALYALVEMLIAGREASTNGGSHGGPPQNLCPKNTPEPNRSEVLKRLVQSAEIV